MRRLRFLLLALAGALLAFDTTRAVTRLASADGQFWDIQDTSTWAQDSGGIATGGRAHPFNGFGYLKLEVARPGGAPTVRNLHLRGFGLAHDGEAAPGCGVAETGPWNVVCPVLSRSSSR